MNWLEIAVTVSSEGEEAVTDIFYRLGSKGVVVEAPETIKQYIDSGIWDYHDFGEIEVTGNIVVKGYFPQDKRLDSRVFSLREELLTLKQMFPEWVIDSETLMVKEEDWANEWKRFFKPIRIGEHILIKPTWEEIEPLDDDVVIEIDPGMAFGTGTHPTTSLSLEAVEKYVRPGQTVFDIGTGSGILAVAAAKLGALVQAGDIDDLAVKVAQDNIALNQVEDRVRVEAGNLGEVFKGQADIVIANIIADIIIELLPQLTFLLKPNGIFIASGIIDLREDEVKARVAEEGFELIDCLEDSGWVLLVARMPDLYLSY